MKPHIYQHLGVWYCKVQWLHGRYMTTLGPGRPTPTGAYAAFKKLWKHTYPQLFKRRRRR